MNVATISGVQVDRDVVARTGRLFRRLVLRSIAGAPRFSTRFPPSLPSILVVTIPKSGTVFTNQMLSRGLSLEARVGELWLFPTLPHRHPKTARGELAFIHKILDFYEIPHSLFRQPVIEKTVFGSHFRAGLEDEWTTAFTADQIAKANAQIGRDLIERFG